MTQQELYAFLLQHDHAVLASVSPIHTPEAALVGVAVTEELELVFDTSRDTRKYVNLIINHNVALVIGWTHEITLQYEGEARMPTGDKIAHYKQVYFARFPSGRERESWPDIAYFVVKPRWVRYSDFSQDPPQIVEMTFEG